jgi:hypothetical protein
MRKKYNLILSFMKWELFILIINIYHKIFIIYRYSSNSLILY